MLPVFNGCDDASVGGQLDTESRICSPTFSYIVREKYHREGVPIFPHRSRVHRGGNVDRSRLRATQPRSEKEELKRELPNTSLPIGAPYLFSCSIGTQGPVRIEQGRSPSGTDSRTSRVGYWPKRAFSQNEFLGKERGKGDIFGGRRSGTGSSP